MASTCPNCGRKLHWYDVKAECSQCGVNIPNFNWEARLEEDNIKAERQFQAFYKTLNIFKYSVFGTKLRIVRIILSFLPAIGFIIPWASLRSDAGSFGIDLLGLFTDGKSLIDLFGIVFGNIGLIIENMGYEGFSGPVTYLMASLLFMILSVLTIVIAFFLILITFKKPKSKAMVVTDAISILFTVMFGVMFALAISASGTVAAYTFGDFPVLNASGSVAWGLIVYIVLLCVAMVGNILVAKSSIKSEEQLEEERLAKKAIKDAKAKEDAIKKEKAREEAAKKAAEEEAQRVAEARAKLEGK